MEYRPPGELRWALVVSHRPGHPLRGEFLGIVPPDVKLIELGPRSPHKYIISITIWSGRRYTKHSDQAGLCKGLEVISQEPDEGKLFLWNVQSLDTPEGCMMVRI